MKKEKEKEKNSPGVEKGNLKRADPWDPAGPVMAKWHGCILPSTRSVSLFI